MDEKQTHSTSSSSASVNDIVMREGSVTRLIFRPLIVENPKDSAAAVRGWFLFQRKGRTEAWEDTKKIPLNTLKKGEGYQLELKSSEVLNLFRELSSLYDIHKATGVPMGTQSFVRASPQLATFANLKPKELTGLIEGREELGMDLLSKLISWARKEGNLLETLSNIAERDAGTLKNLDLAIGVASLKEMIRQYNLNIGNSDEEYWQEFFSKNPIFLEQIFPYPVIIIKGKAYVGGKSVKNVGGNIVDYLIKNELTKSTAIIEIKTPKTRLLAEEYRSGVYNLSRDLSGATLQVINYKRNLLLEFNNLAKEVDLEIADPSCVVIIGNAGEELSTAQHRSSFELFRSQLSGVQIVTFDEIIRRAEHMISIFENIGELKRA